MAEHPEDAFARLIRLRRVDLGLTQRDLAQAAGLSVEAIKRLEAGKARNPDPRQVRLICQALKLSTLEAAVALGYVDESDLQTRHRPPDVTSAQKLVAFLEDAAFTHEEKKVISGFLRRRLAAALDFDAPPTLDPEERQRLREAEERADREAERIYGDQQSR